MKKILFFFVFALHSCVYYENPCRYNSYEVVEKSELREEANWVRIRRNETNDFCRVYVTTHDYNRLQVGQIIECEPARLKPAQ